MSFEGFGLLFTVALLGAIGVVLFIGLRGRRLPAAVALGEGRYADVLKDVGTPEHDDRDALYATAVAAKHLLDWDRSEALLQRILAEDDDGEAWLELGLVSTYRGRWDEALAAFDRAAAIRADLLESLNLHRAYARLRNGDLDGARKLFEEIEAPLETKLRTDIGSGEPAFLEWFLQAAALWRATGRETKAGWASAEAARTTGDSRLPELYGAA